MQLVPPLLLLPFRQVSLLLLLLLLLLPLLLLLLLLLVHRPPLLFSSMLGRARMNDRVKRTAGVRRLLLCLGL